jgi:hypothetical protein
LVVRNLRIEEGGGKGGGGSAGGITEFAEAASGTLRIRGFSGGGFENICNEGGSKQFRRFVTKLLLAFSSCPA